MSVAYVALGANLGNPRATLRQAIDALGALPHSRRIAASGFYRTAPMGFLEQPDFINAVVSLETALAPTALLEALFAIEIRFGRQRGTKDAPRTLDLDLLLHDDHRCDTPDLTLPHPRMHQRAFVLAPLAEIAPDLTLPQHGPITALLAKCADQIIERLP